MASYLRRFSNLRFLSHHLNITASPGVFWCPPSWCASAATSTIIVRHGSARVHARDAVKRVVPDGSVDNTTPMGELSTMPNFAEWHRYFGQLCGQADRADRYVSSEEWDKIYKQFQETSQLSKAGFYGAMMSLACSFRFQRLGDSILDHLQAKAPGLNVTVLSRYFKLTGRCNPPDAEAKIFQAYAQLKKIYPADIYDALTAENLISGLYRTSRWEDCLKLLDMISFSGRAGPVAISLTATGAFLHGQSGIALRLLKQLRESQVLQCSPMPQLFEAWFDWARGQGSVAIMELLTLTRDAEWFLSFDVVKGLREYMEAGDGVNRWTGKFTTLSAKGECKGCQAYMELITITKEEFAKLRENFIQAVIEGTDVFLKTNPGELKRYRAFVEENAPFDLVVDGLNVAYKQNTGNANGRTLATQLRKVIEYLQGKRRRKILILGRAHMRNWPKDELARISNVATVFLAENISQDDPFMLYAALYSGLGCDILSGDLMRDHRFKLALRDDELRQIFVKWQRTHQMEVLKIHPDSSVALKAPMRYNAVAQWTDTSMHVPYHSGLPLSLHEVPSTWLCLTKVGNSVLR